MQPIAYSPETARRHAPVVQRAVAIFAALGGGAAVRLRHAGDPAGAGHAGDPAAGSGFAGDPPAASGFAGDPPAGAHERCIILEQAAACALTRLDGERRPGRDADPRPGRDADPRPGRDADARHWHLAYDDPARESVLAALIACASAPGAPIAADAESLSIVALAERLAASEIPVLVGGPTGTGKEVLSRFIHARSPRARGPFVAVNCAAMPEAMLEAMLFGHVKGAFTGATAASEGFFRAADGGTLLLDEIAEMPLILQAKLLRALQEGEVVPIGATRPIPVDVRIIAAANRDLPTEVAAGRFRADLYYRLNVFPLSLKPLRERPGDIAPLAFAMVLRHRMTGRGAAGGAGGAMPWISDAALDVLRRHNWPGNVRELENVMRRALLLSEAMAGGDSTIGPAHIRFDAALRPVEADAAAAYGAQFAMAGQDAGGHGGPARTGFGGAGFGGAPSGSDGFMGAGFMGAGFAGDGFGGEHFGGERFGMPGDAIDAAGAGHPATTASGRRLAGIVRQSEAQAIRAALAHSNGNRAAAARRLGISERTLRYRLAAFRAAGIVVEGPVAGLGRVAGAGGTR